MRVYFLIVVMALSQFAIAPSAASSSGINYWGKGVPQAVKKPEENTQQKAAPSSSNEQAEKPQSNNPFEALQNAASAFQLAKSPTAESAIRSIENCERAFAFYKNIGNKMGMAVCSFESSSCYFFLGRLNESLSEALDALRYSEEAGPDIFSLRPAIEGGIGAAYAKMGEAGKALGFLERASKGLKESTFPPILAAGIRTLKSMGVSIAGIDLEELPKNWETAHRIYRAFVLKNLGEVNNQIGRRKEAIEPLEEALELYRQAGSWQDQFEVLASLQASTYPLGLTKKASEYASQALELTRANSSADSEPYGLFSLAAMHVLSGDLKQGISEYERALDMLRRENDRKGEALVLNNLGLVYFNRGDINLALEYFNKALKIGEELNDNKMQAYALNNLGSLHSQRGDPVTALRYYERVLGLARKVKDRRAEASVLINMAATSPFTISPDHTAKMLEEAVEVFRSIGESGYETESIISLADVYAALGRPEKGLDILHSALESRRAADDPRREGYILREMAHLYLSQRNWTEALSRYNQALSRLQAAGDEMGQTDIYIGVATVHFANNDLAQAKDLYLKGINLARSSGLKQREEIGLTMLGFLHETQGELEQAEKFYDQATAAGESARTSAGIDELKTEIAAVSSRLISSAILLKFKLGKYSEAFELCESARARTFLDQMKNVHLDIRKGSDPQMIEQEQALSLEIRKLEGMLGKERLLSTPSEAVSVLASTLKEKQQEYAALLVRLKASNPEYAQLRSYTPTSLKEIQRLLGPQSTMVSYFVTSDKTLAFIITSDSLRAVEIPVKESALRDAITWFRAFSSLGDSQPKSLQQLHSWLIEPLRPFLRPGSVVIVPHSILHYLPFAALNDGTHYFGDEHPISYLPSASILPTMSRQNYQSNSILAVSQSRVEGSPALRFADSEVETVAKLFNSQPLSTGRSTKAEFLKRSPISGVIHIAAHAELNTNSPLFSRIFLSPDKENDGALELREVYGLTLPKTTLVVLSACNTQLGIRSNGDDIVSLNRAFIYAGAKSVIASLWAVDDESTTLFMKTFYASLNNGSSKAIALQIAQSETRKLYPHPYYWAGFVLTGQP